MTDKKTRVTAEDISNFEKEVALAEVKRNQAKVRVHTPHKSDDKEYISGKLDSTEKRFKEACKKLKKAKRKKKLQPASDWYSKNEKVIRRVTMGSAWVAGVVVAATGLGIPVAGAIIAGGTAYGTRGGKTVVDSISKMFRKNDVKESD